MIVLNIMDGMRNEKRQVRHKIQARMSYKDNVELGSMESKAPGIYKTTKIFLPLQYIYLYKKK